MSNYDSLIKTSRVQIEDVDVNLFLYSIMDGWIVYGSDGVNTLFEKQPFTERDKAVSQFNKYSKNIEDSITLEELIWGS